MSEDQLKQDYDSVRTIMSNLTSALHTAQMKADKLASIVGDTEKELSLLEEKKETYYKWAVPIAFAIFATAFMGLGAWIF